MTSWTKNSVFYHIYPIGLCGCPDQNDYKSTPVPRLNKLYDWIPYLKDLNINAVYFGPVFESSSHGYDTKDFYAIDRRLGTNEDFSRLAAAFHENGIKVVLDGIFNHAGRDFFAFENLKSNLHASPYKEWFADVDFGRKSPYGDPFSYSCWSGHYNLVKLNLKNKDVKEHIFKAVKSWIDQFKIEGLRLDAADCLDHDFVRELSAFCRNIKPDFWLMGELIHGDYRKWVNDGMLDSATNYECYKGLYSSHNDRNYFEIAYSLNRLFGEKGIYKNLYLYNFADNHDVDRIASLLKNINNIYPLYCILFTMPGIPSVYYGSEWAVTGKKQKESDRDLRPEVFIDRLRNTSQHPDLHNVIKKLAGIRMKSEALKSGSYRQLHVSHQEFAFSRETGNDAAIVAVNSGEKEKTIELDIDHKYNNWKFYDALDENYRIDCMNGKLKFNLLPNRGRILIADFK